MKTNFHEMFGVRNNTDLGLGYDAPGRRRKKEEPKTKAKTETWSDGKNTYSGKVRRDVETGRALEVSARTINGSRIMGTAEFSGVKKAAVEAFTSYESAAMEKRAKEEAARLFNSAHATAVASLDSVAKAVKESDRAARGSASSGRASEIKESASGRSASAVELLGLPPIVGSSGVRVSHLPATNQTSVSATAPPNDNFEAVESVVVGGGKRWDIGDWVGDEVTEYLKIPYDGTTAPEYVTKEDFDELDWSSMPLEDGSDDRSDAMFINLTETLGPVFHVHRA